MNLRRVIASRKHITNVGTWSHGVKMPKSAYPLSRNTGFKVTASFAWRVVHFDCLGERFRLLMAYRVELAKAFCYLGRDVGGDMLTMGRYEYHSDEPGWHLHCYCDDDGKAAGSLQTNDKRIPGHGSRNRRPDFGIHGDADMWKTAADAFRLIPPFELEPT